MTPEESARYWAAKKAQHQRALDFLAEARPGDTYRIERYALPQTGIPHELSEDADVHEKRVITLYAVHNGNGAYWFTTTTGEAIEADTLIKWERLPKQTPRGGYSLRGITGADELRETENGKLLLNEGIKNYV